MGKKVEKIKKICPNCGKEFTPNSNTHKYCTKECKNKYYKQNNVKRNTFVYICAYCGKKLENRYKARSEHQFCNAYCRNKFNKEKLAKGFCIECGSVYNKRHKNHNFCCEECRREYIRKNPPLIHTYVCDNCGIEFKTSAKKKCNNKFCSNKCFGLYNHKTAYEDRKCEICGQYFHVSKKSTQRFCSIECQGIWQSQYRVGENSSTYDHSISKEERTITCEICGKEFEVGAYKVETARFCSGECRQEWFANVWSQSEDWKEESRIRAVKILSDGFMNHTDTKPQVIVNSLLDDLGIEYKNEFNAKYFAIDNYLIESGLFCEVMGDYWHCNHRVYDSINYEMQYKRIITDKRKHTYIKNKYGKEILYLWESDIYNNPDLCIELIKLYIKNDGVLNAYHSFNYHIKDGTVKQNNTIEYPYMMRNSNDLKRFKKYKNIKKPT